MKDNKVLYYINFDLLRFIRDSKPTKEEFIGWLGENKQDAFFTLLKANLLTVKDNKIYLSEENLSNNGKIFRFSNQVFHIDEYKIDTLILKKY